MNTLPIIDVSKLGETQTLTELERSLREVGFIYLKNHGVDQPSQEKLMALSKKFFSQTLDEKMKISMKKGGLTWRGYFPLGGELTSGKPDQKEGLYFGAELTTDHPLVKKKTPLHGANLWPVEIPEMKDVVLSYMFNLTRLAQKLMSAIALSLELPSDYFLKRFTSEPTTLFRIFNYPEHIWTHEEDQWGVREHTDMGFLTILLQDNSGGLEVKATDGQWIAAPPIKNTFVVNIGDMLEVWTHGLYRATPHRVRNHAKGDRLSIPFFFDPNWTCTLEPISKSLISGKLHLIDPKVQERWDGLNLYDLTGKMTYGDFVWRKVKGVFPGLTFQPETST